jgi:hypothetical protein
MVVVQRWKNYLGCQEDGMARSYPKGVKDIMEPLCREVTLLHAHSKIYRQLFGDQTTVDLLNRTASAVFKALQDSLSTEIILLLMRLIDPPEYKRQKRISLYLLVDELQNQRENELSRDVKSDADAIKALLKGFKDLRNLSLAHTDFNTIHNVGPVPWHMPSEADFEHAMELVRTALNRVSIHYRQVQKDFVMVGLKGDGRVLVERLRRALQNT